MSLYGNAISSISVGVEGMQSSDVGRVISVCETFTPAYYCS